MRISRGGQLTVPASIRHRWGTERVEVEDHGDHLVVRPLADPIAAFIGFAAGRTAVTAEQVRALNRAEEATSERRRSK